MGAPEGADPKGTPIAGGASARTHHRTRLRRGKNRHHMAGVFVGRLKFQPPAFVSRMRQQLEDRPQLGVSMAVQIKRSAIPRTHHGPGFLYVGHKAVIQAQ